MSDVGNAEMVRAVADQLYDAWEARQGKKHASWPAWLGVGLSVAALIFGAGVLRSDVATATNRIEKLEVRADGQDRMTGSTNDRLARIETKLDLALEKRR